MITAMDTGTDTGGAFRADGFRLGGPPAPTLVELDRPVVVAETSMGPPAPSTGVPVRQLSADDHVLDAVVDGQRVRAVVNVQPHVMEVAWQGQRHVFVRPDRLADTADVGDGSITAPMPGTVLDVRVTVGQEVAEGDVLGAMEAMKMELSLKAPFAGTVTEVDAVVGQQVALGATLFAVQAADG